MAAAALKRMHAAVYMAGQIMAPTNVETGAYAGKQQYYFYVIIYAAFCFYFLNKTKREDFLPAFFKRMSLEGS